LIGNASNLYAVETHLQSINHLILIALLQASDQLHLGEVPNLLTRTDHIGSLLLNELQILELFVLDKLSQFEMQFRLAKDILSAL